MKPLLNTPLLCGNGNGRVHTFTMRAHTNNPPDENDRRLRRWVTLFVLVGLLELPLLTWPWLAPLILPKRFSTHRDQITASLQGRGVALTQLFFEQGWPDRINNQTYGANLILYISDAPNAKPVIGRMECREGKRKCWYGVAALGIAREELDDLTPPAPAEPAMTDRLQETLSHLVSWLFRPPN